MKARRILVTFALLLVAGCQNKDELALQPYASIPRGSAIVLLTKVDGKDYTSFPVRKFDLLLTNECVLEEIRDGTLWVSDFHGKRLGFAGSMVKSIVVEESPSPIPAESAKP
jgi:hypothetical protein